MCTGVFVMLLVECWALWAGGSEPGA